MCNRQSTACAVQAIHTIMEVNFQGASAGIILLPTNLFILPPIGGSQLISLHTHLCSYCLCVYIEHLILAAIYYLYSLGPRMLPQNINQNVRILQSRDRVVFSTYTSYDVVVH